MLVAGGLLDQPIALWFAQAQAGYVWSLLERISQPGYNLFDDDTLTRFDYEMLDEIEKVRSALREQSNRREFIDQVNMDRRRVFRR